MNNSKANPRGGTVRYIPREIISQFKSNGIHKIENRITKTQVTILKADINAATHVNIRRYYFEEDKGNLPKGVSPEKFVTKDLLGNNSEKIVSEGLRGRKLSEKFVPWDLPGRKPGRFVSWKMPGIFIRLYLCT